MKTGYKVALYGIALAVIFGGTWAAGAATGPPAPPPAHSAEAEHGGTHDETQSKLPPGLSVSDNGYTLRLNENKSLAFQIEGPDGLPITKFAVEHEKPLHLIVVRRDGSNFQHVHPSMAPDSTWSIPLTLPQAGSYRVFADFKPEDGPKTTLGADIQVAGDYRPQNHIDGSTFTVDGYEVSLTGELNAGKASTVTMEITKNGTKVTDLQNYLGAKGHLVALRASDLAYLHVHPEQSDQVKFAVEVPTAGKYRLFLDFQHENVVRTAEFTLTTHGEGGHGH
ncbi:hypothetical protein SK854_43095 [Lentzea sp. BCCO 10_0061]|uniref:Secreted protein n=1 Tax=Lentzea sokolovensis TaxID=3095429 RepID=A0ABU4VDF4_9PSEU|nr:hypothetical protein [Lentzea sp. BCCO 10_0061]MDX8148968.1 hypothetical protein [Lentzea sp. BCCO 10_0061]